MLDFRITLLIKAINAYLKIPPTPVFYSLNTGFLRACGLPDLFWPSGYGGEADGHGSLLPRTNL